MRTTALLTLLLCSACDTKSDGASDPFDTGMQDGSEDANPDGDTGGDGDGPPGAGDGDNPGQQTAPLRALSDGECPDMTVSGTDTFSSGGQQRKATTVIPNNFEPGMPLVFFFHGLLDGSMSNPAEYHVSGLGLQDIADEAGVVFVLPESPVMTLMGMSFFMWTVNEYEGEDIILYDDLRACAAQQLEVDLNRVHATGFSGGALFVTVVARDRGDTLASVVEMSGGSDLALPLFSEPFSEYDTPAYDMPALLVTGGSTDIWPNDAFTLVDFVAATDELQGQLAEDGHYVVRCDHGQGHTVTYSTMDMAWAWVDSHEYGVPSPYLQSGIGNDSSWCEEISGAR